jgi:hypothetical protein
VTPDGTLTAGAECAGPETPGRAAALAVLDVVLESGD